MYRAIYKLLQITGQISPLTVVGNLRIFNTLVHDYQICSQETRNIVPSYGVKNISIS